MKTCTYISARHHQEAVDQNKDRVKFIPVPTADRRRWTEAMQEPPARTARELDGKGMKGIETFRAYVRFMRQAAHAFPFDYPVRGAPVKTPASSAMDQAIESATRGLHAIGATSIALLARLDLAAAGHLAAVQGPALRAIPRDIPPGAQNESHARPHPIHPRRGRGH